MRRNLFLWLAMLSAPAAALAQTAPPAPVTQQPPAPQNPPPTMPVTQLPPAPQNPPPTAPITQPPPTAIQPAPAKPLAPTLQKFDPKQIQLRHVDNHWMLVADGVLLRDFGIRESEAREAQRVIRTLNLNQLGTVGGPQPGLEFWLSDGHAPLGTAPGLRVLPLDLNSLQVQHIDKVNNWVVRDKQRILGSFGDNREQAFLALDLIRRYGFCQQAVVGMGMPSMSFFLGNLSEKARWEVPQNPTTKNGQPNTGAKATPTVAAPPPVERLHFTTDHVEVRESNRHWKLMVGKQELADFGPDQHLARQALNMMNYYRFTDQVTIGPPERGFRYFLSNGQAPVGVRFGVQSQPFRPEALLVRQQNGQCMVCDGETVVMGFDNRLADVQQFVQVVQRYHFDRLCSLGYQNGLGMTFLAKSR